MKWSKHEKYATLITLESDKMYKYQYGIDFLTKHLIFLGVYVIGYHHYPIFYIAIPSLVPYVFAYLSSNNSTQASTPKEIQISDNTNVETADWCNRTVERFWPLLDDVAKSWMINKLCKLSQKFMRSDNHRFKINNATWGTCSPKIQDVQIKNVSNVSNGDILNLDFDLTHDSDSEIELSYSPLNITTIIRKFSLKGILRVVLYPLPEDDNSSGFEAIEVLFPSEPEVDFELGGLASVLKSLGLVDTTRIVSRYLSSTKFVLKFVKRGSKAQLRPSWELRKKSDVSNFGVKKLVEQTSGVIFETVDHPKDSQQNSSLATILTKRSKDHGNINGFQNLNGQEPSKVNTENKPNSNIGKVKLGIKYSAENEELEVNVYEAKELDRPPSFDLPDAQIQIYLSKLNAKVSMIFW